LHETFDNPTRVLTTPPFCVKENGYGEFELPIDIFFHGSNEKYSLNYFLKLPPLNTSLPLSKLRREIITFINPCADFRRKLIEGGASVQPLTSSDTVAAYTNGGTHGSTKPVKTTFSSLSSPSSSSSLLSNHQLILNASIDANNHENNSLIKSSSKKKHSLNSSGLVANVTTVKQPQKLNNSTTNPNSNNVSSSKSIKNSHTSNDSTPNNNNNNSKSNANNGNGKVSTINNINNNHNNSTSNDSAVKKTLTNKKVREINKISLWT
jgi:hypothetical protein